ncbi:hypothetical protein LINPERHAP2_LOCUS2466, partial [Linum perenne]
QCTNPNCPTRSIKVYLEPVSSQVQYRFIPNFNSISTTNHILVTLQQRKTLTNKIDSSNSNSKSANPPDVSAKRVQTRIYPEFKPKIQRKLQRKLFPFITDCTLL